MYQSWGFWVKGRFCPGGLGCGLRLRTPSCSQGTTRGRQVGSLTEGVSKEGGGHRGEGTQSVLEQSECGGGRERGRSHLPAPPRAAGPPPAPGRPLVGLPGPSGHCRGSWPGLRSFLIKLAQTPPLIALQMPTRGWRVTAYALVAGGSLVLVRVSLSSFPWSESGQHDADTAWSAQRRARGGHGVGTGWAGAGEWVGSRCGCGWEWVWDGEWEWDGVGSRCGWEWVGVGSGSGDGGAEEGTGGQRALGRQNWDGWSADRGQR